MLYSKSPWEACASAERGVQKISWPVLMFCSVSSGQARFGASTFCLGCVSRPTTLPTPFSLPLGYFSGPVLGTCPTQIETCQCGLCVFWHRLEQRISLMASIRAPGSPQTRRGLDRGWTVGSGCTVCTCLPLIGMSPWEHPEIQAIANQYSEKMNMIKVKTLSLWTISDCIIVLQY